MIPVTVRVRNCDHFKKKRGTIYDKETEKAVV